MIKRTSEERRQKMQFRVWVTTMLFVFLTFTLVLATSENISWWSVNGGGNVNSSSPNYAIRSSVGQPVSGKATGGSYQSSCGFWLPWSSPSDVDEDEDLMGPRQFSISQNYPNPFNPNTLIEYALPKTSHVKIVIYNILGQKVRILKDEMEQSGHKTVIWDGKDDSGNEVSSGIYFYRIVAGDFIKSMKMLMVK
jgi:hypothetical protein